MDFLRDWPEDLDLEGLRAPRRIQRIVELVEPLLRGQSQHAVLMAPDDYEMDGAALRDLAKRAKKCQWEAFEKWRKCLPLAFRTFMV